MVKLNFLSVVLIYWNFTGCKSMEIPIDIAALVADVNGCTQIYDSKYSTFYTQRLPGRKSYRPYT
jgi:hypothetical protein